MADNTQIPTGEGGDTSSPKVKGPIKTDLSGLATHLKRKPIAFAAAGIVGGVLLAGYAAIDIIPHMGGGASKPKVTIQQAPDMHVQKPTTPVATPAASAQSAAAPAKSASTTPPNVAPVPRETYVPAPANTGPSPQMAAFQAAMGGNTSGGSRGGWGDSQSATAAVASTPAQAQANALTLAKSIAEMTGKAQKKGGVYEAHLDRKEVSPYEVLQGSVIPAVLETGIKSDISGEVTAVVAHPVYNSLNGAFVLIPAGSKLVGTYKSGAAMGQSRVGVMWTRIEFPNGTYIQLGHMEGSSPGGYAGFKDLVNNHTWEIFKNALLLSFIDVGMSIASPTSSSTNTTGVTGNEALQDGEQSLAQTFGQAESQLFQKYINIAPTITIRPGYAFNVVVARDLVFPGPYVHGAAYVGTTATGQPAAPTEINPYGG